MLLVKISHLVSKIPDAKDGTLQKCTSTALLHFYAAIPADHKKVQLTLPGADSNEKSSTL